ncbi:MAG: polysaccharide deacetylase family protein [Proteobacteria bacterium]|nr:polysaccharide deacetylase family protein [Pseudomonadota bacterium]
MKKLFFGLQLLLILGICAVIIYTAVKPLPPLQYYPESWRSWEGFYVLSYVGITRKGEGDYITQKRLGDHLNSLKQAGFNTITPEDAVAFLDGRAPLPDKAILIMFEGGRKDSFLYATPLLRKFGMIACMCVPTSFSQTWGGFYLKEHDIKNLSHQAHWRLCSMGNDAIKKVPIDGSGSQGHFLTHRMWQGNKVEDDSAFKNRVIEDYAKSAKLLEKASGRPVVAYLYPFADPGGGANTDPASAVVNRKALASHYRIAFISADNPFNSLYKNPYRLSRLRVPSNWDGPHLIKELHKFLPLQSPINGLSDESIWFKSGDVHQVGKTVTLSPGSVLWLRGSDDWSDQDISVTIRLSTGATASLYVRYGGNDSSLRLTITHSTISLHERIKTVFQTLVLIPATLLEGSDNELRLKVKRNRAWVWHGDKLIAGPVPLSPAITYGRIGIGCRDAKIQLLNFSAKPLPRIYTLADSYRSLPPSIQEEISAILPVWIPQDFTSGLSAQKRFDLLTAASSGVQTIPIIEVNKDITPEEAQKCVASIISTINHPAVKPLQKYFAVYGLETTLPALLHKHGFGVVRILFPQQAISFVEQKQKLIPSDMLLIDGPEKEAKKAFSYLLHTIPPSRLSILLDSRTSSPLRASTAVQSVKRTEEKGNQ